MSESNPALEQRLAALRAAFSEALPGRVQRLWKAWTPLRDGRWDAEGYRAAMRQAHSLAGAGATFGHSRISEPARRVERALQQALDDHRALAPQERSAVDTALDGLKRAAGLSGGTGSSVGLSAGSPSE
jgi:chemotaxis protein histidine kinase CheA